MKLIHSFEIQANKITFLRKKYLTFDFNSYRRASLKYAVIFNPIHNKISTFECRIRESF